jgi:hypothetical protein
MAPDQGHSRQANALGAARQTTAAAFRKNPDRFVNKSPMPPASPTEAWIHPPQKILIFRLIIIDTFLSANHMLKRLDECRVASNPLLPQVIQQVRVRQKMRGEVSAQGKVGMATVTADTSDLDRALIEVHVVALMSVGCGIVAGDRNVDGSVDRDVDVYEATGEMAVATVAGAVGAGRDHIRADQTLVSRKNTHAAARPRVAVAALTPDPGHLKGALIEIHVV